MEYVSCDLCGADAASPLLKRADRFSGESFQYVMCRECGLIYLNPRPDANRLLDYYPNDYEAYRSPETLTPLAQWRWQDALHILRRFVTLHHSPGRLLDVGCATGKFLKEMRMHGWQVQGVELYSEAAAVAREKHGLDVFVGPLTDFTSHDGTFDVVTLWDVLEHLSSPRSALQSINHWLSDRGCLVFSIPNMRSFDARLFGHWWIGWDAPRHFYLFPDQALNRLLTETGFEIKDKSCLLGGPGAFQLSYQFLLNNRVRSTSVRRMLESLLPLSPYLLWPYKELSYALGRGPVITIAARKMGSS